MTYLMPLRSMHIISVLISGVLLGGAFTRVYANEPAAPVKCTNLPRSGWVDEQRIRQVFGESKYRQVFVKISRGNCYEFYAIGKDNTVAEAYYDPVSMELMQSTHIGIDGKSTIYDRPVAPTAVMKSKSLTKSN
jgi:hypothetical protein